LPTQNSNVWHGPIALQKKRLAQLNTLIEQYSRLLEEDPALRAKFDVALDRARKQKVRIQHWLAVHDKPPVRKEPPQKVQSATASWFCSIG
jgi:hypothetical protein